MTTIARFEWEDSDDSDGVHKNDIRWDYGSGGFAMCDGITAYAQTIEAVVKTVRGELITRRNYGIPYFSTIFSGQVYADEWARAVQDAVADLDFIESIDLFEYKYDQRRKVMTYRLEVTTTDGNNVAVTEV